MRLAFRTGILCCLLMLWVTASGCHTLLSTGGGSLISPRLPKRNYTIVKHGAVGSACRYSVLGIPLSQDRLHEAFQGIYRQATAATSVEDYALVNVVRTNMFTFYLFYTRTCDTVMADIAVLKEPILDGVHTATPK